MTRDEKIVASFGVMQAVKDDPSKKNDPKWQPVIEAALAFIQTMPQSEINELFETDDDWAVRMRIKHGPGFGYDEQK